MALFLSALMTAFIVALHGYSFNQMLKAGVQNLKLVQRAMILLGTISVIIPLWLQIGVLPNFIYYSVGVVSSLNPLLFGFLMATALSMVIGTALGTMTILVPLFMSIAYNLGIPEALMVGALVSGAYFGDRTSPMSAVNNLNAEVTQSNIQLNMRLMLVSSVMPLALSLGLYSHFGRPYASTDTPSVLALKEALAEGFTIHPGYLTPVILLIALILFKVPILKSLALVYGLSLVIYSFQGFDLSQFMNFSVLGYSTSDPYLGPILRSNGLLNMLQVLGILVSSSFLNGLYELSNLFEKIITPFIRSLKSYFEMNLKVSLLSILFSIITCNQTLSVIITGKLFAPYYDRFQIRRNYLARTLGDTGVTVVGIIPWNLNGIFVAALTGVATLDYLPYAFFTLSLPIFSMAVQPLFMKKSF
ncbi:MAG: hypothetical protein AVO33_00395 [delta proteobacterium ML8_F1]|nr:MAG: hypothetical protein AVO33_00395 [delta proteobacterium ML8_F1]